MRDSWRMRLITLALVLAVGLAYIPTSNAAITIKQKVGEKEYKFQLYGFSQLEMRGGDGQSSEGGIKFQAQRIRLGTKYFHGGWFAKLFLDFNQPWDKGKLGKSDPGEAGLPKAIKDAFVGYRWNDSAFIRMGMIKAPVGMGFTNPGWNLDIVERNKLEKGLQLERTFGLMLSGRLIGGAKEDPKHTSGTEMGHERMDGYGFGYDIGVFNPTGRSAAVTWDPDLLGDALAYAGRVHYDNGWKLHIEASYGVSEQAGGIVIDKAPFETEDYDVFDIGVLSYLMDKRLNLALEYVSGSNIKGVDGWDQDCWVGTVAYMFTSQVEGVIKHYQASATKGNVDTDMTNTYFGVNFYISPLKNSPRAHQSHRIQVNYVLTGGDDAGARVPFNGLAGVKDSSWLMQWQYKF